MRRSSSIARRLAPALSIAVLAVGLLGAVPAAAASTIAVDADGRATATDCDASAAARTSIQAAVDAAAPGATIRVCPGSYQELVSVGAGKNGLTIAGARPFAAKLRIPQGVDVDALLAVDGADGVTVRGLTLLSGSGKSCGRVKTAILVRDARNAIIRGNRLAPTTTDTQSVCSFPWGIAVGVAPSVPAAELVSPASAFVAWNLIRDTTWGGIQALGDETSVTIRRNSVRYWHLAEVDRFASRRALVRPAGNLGPAGISLLLGADGLVANNAVTSGPDADPIRDVLKPAGPIISTPTLPIGIAAAGAGSVRIVDNLVLRVRQGIQVSDNGSARVTDNRIRTVRNGIVAGDTGARYLRNSVRTAIVGIAALRDGQTFVDNAVVDGSRVDCVDETTGEGTHGTGNTWTDNSGAVSYPVDICGSGAPDIDVVFVATPGPAPSGSSDGTPGSVAGTFPGSPLTLESDGVGSWQAQTRLPLGGSYSYSYRDVNGQPEPCRPARDLVVVNQGGLRMVIQDTVDFTDPRTAATC